MKILKNIVLPLLCLTPIVTAVFSCTNEMELGGDGAQETVTTFTIQVPAGGFKPSDTRSLTGADENTIEEIDVLVFRKDDAADPDNAAVYFDRTRTEAIKDEGNDGSGNALKSFRVSVKKSDKPLQFIIIANAGAAVDAAAATFTEGVTLREDALNALIMESPTKWNSTTGANDPLPMWGETAFRTLTDAASASDVIDMVRVHSRIDVTVNPSARPAFSLSGVWLFNPSTKGLIAPPSWSAGTISLPVSGRAAAAAPFEYDAALITGGVSLTGNIYAFEAPAAAGNTDASAPFIVVGGSWNGEVESYYRIDFARTENNATAFMPLLRNYHYEVDITSVAGRGYPNITEAAAAGFTDLTATVHQWAQGQMGTVVWEGRDWLAVSDIEVELTPEAQSITLLAATTYTSGWKAEVKLDPSDEAGWLTIDGSSSGTGNAVNPPVGSLKLDARDNFTSSPERIGIVTVSAGRLKQEITVIQKRNKELDLLLGDVEIVFSAANPQPAQLRVEWKPGAIPCDVENKTAPDGEGGIVYDRLAFTANPLTAVTDPANEGAVNYTITPDAFTIGAADPFEERRSTLTITANDGATPVPNTMEQTVLLRQFNYGIEVTGLQDGNFYQQYTTYALTVRCNGEWEMAVSDPNSILTSISTPAGEPNTTAAGEKVTFTMSDPSKAGMSATLTFRSTASPALFPDKVVTVTMRKNEPNCYIVPPVAGRNTAQIPIAKVFDIWKNDEDLNGTNPGGDPTAMNSTSGYTAEVLWMDELGLITSVSAPSAQNRTGVITVTVNTTGIEGNAVVGLKENGVIRWGWHIWVCNFDPEQNIGYNSYNGAVIMDRDLGAINTVKGNIGSYGLYYQWGRFTPFPKVSGVNSTTFKNIYGIGGGARTINRVDIASQTATTRNLALALNNPLTYYYTSRQISNIVDQDWYSSSLSYEGEYYRRNFWTSIKSEFDPCPDGWQVPNKNILDFVPVTGTFTSPGGEYLYDIIGNPLGLFATSGRMLNTNIHGIGVVNFGWYIITQELYGCYYAVRNNELVASNFARQNGVTVRCMKTE